MKSGTNLKILSVMDQFTYNINVNGRKNRCRLNVALLNKVRNYFHSDDYTYNRLLEAKATNQYKWLNNPKITNYLNTNS